TVPEEDKCPRSRLEHVGEVLGGHAGRSVAIDVRLADHQGRGVAGDLGLAGMVDQRWVPAPEIEIHRGAVSGGRILGDASDGDLYPVHHLGPVSAAIAPDLHILWDDVVSVASVDLSDADDRGIEGTDGPAHDALQRRHNVSGRDYGIETAFRSRGVRATPGHLQVEARRRCHDWPGTREKLAHGIARRIV